MKKTLFILTVLSITLFANEKIKFFEESNKNELLCRSGYETYIKVNHTNARIEKINGTEYFHMKHQNRYIPVSACHPIKEKDDWLNF